MTILNRRFVHLALALLVFCFSGALTQAQDIEIRKVGSITNVDSGVSYSLEVHAPYAYVADGDKGLQIWNIANPEAPTHLGGLQIPGSTVKVTVAGNYAYLANRTNGLIIADVSDPANPVRVGGLDTEDALDVIVSGKIVYVSDASAGLRVVDVTDPSAPQIVGTLPPTFSSYSQMWKTGDRLVICALNGFEIFDTSNPSAPKLKSATPVEVVSYSVAVSGNHAIFAAGSNGAVIYDIANSVQPSLVGRYSPEAPDRCWPTSLAVAGNIVFLANPPDRELRALDISNPSAPQLVGKFRSLNAFTRVENEGSMLYTTGGAMQILDASRLANPQRLSFIDTPSAPANVTASRQIAYIADYSQGVQIWNVTNPRNPALVGNYGSQVAGKAALADNYLYVPTSIHLEIVDVSDPTHPVRVTYRDLSNLKSVTIVGNHAFVSAGLSGLAIFDASNLTRIGGVDTPGEAMSVVVQGTRAFVADGNGFQIVDISDPSNPNIIGGLTCIAQIVNAIGVSGNHVFTVDNTTGLRAYDISDPTTPTLVSYFRWTPIVNTDLVVVGNIAYVAAGEGGLMVFDVSDPTNMKVIGGNGAFDAAAVHVAGDRIYVTTRENKILVLDGFAAVQLQADAGPGGPVNLKIRSPVASTGRIERSSTLFDWSPWQNVNLTTPEVEVIDSETPESAPQFYRFVSP